MWTAATDLVASHPGAAILAAVAGWVCLWGGHVWRLRRRERDLLLLVDQATRRWQDEVCARRDGATDEGRDGAGRPGAPLPPTARVLVVDDRADQRASIALLLDTLGASAAFADSGWAAAVAADEAAREGAPYDLLLVGPNVPDARPAGIDLPAPMDDAAIVRLLAAAGMQPGGGRGATAARWQGEGRTR
jgi:CheY-like chemotaxis protein